MAGAAIELDVAQLVRMNTAIAADLRRLADADKRQLLADIGVELEGQTQERFDAEQDPDGTAWQPWSERYAQRRAGDGGSILRRSGDLASDVSTQLNDDQVEHGSRKVYAAPHQYGWPERGIPQRQIFGFSPQNVEELGMLVEDFVREHGGMVTA